MKKQYIEPAMICCEVKMEQHLLSASEHTSLYDADATVDGSGNLNNLVKGYNGRSGSVDWDDDWSE